MDNTHDVSVAAIPMTAVQYEMVRRQEFLQILIRLSEELAAETAYMETMVDRE